MIQWLRGDQATAYAGLATEAVAIGLDRVSLPPARGTISNAQTLHLAAGLSFAGLPAALAVLRHDPSHQPGGIMLVSLVVSAPLQRLGLARELLGWLQQQGVELGWRALCLSYPLHHACTTAMQRLTPSAVGWLHRPGLQLVHLSRQGGEALAKRLEPTVVQADRQGRYEVIPWRDYPASRRYNLGPSLQAPAWAWPDDDQGHDPLHQLDAALSCVLLDRQQASGWLIAHRVGDRLFRVSKWWVEPQRQGQGTSLLLLHHAISEALASAIGYHSGAFGMDPSNTPVIRLCQRKILPLASGVTLQQHAWLPLSDDSLELLHPGGEEWSGPRR